MQAPVRGASQPAGCLDTAPSRQDPPPLRGFPTGRPRRPPQLSARPSPATLSVPQRSRAARQQCPATASLTMNSPEEGRRRSWVRRRPQPFPPPVPSASLAAI